MCGICGIALADRAQDVPRQTLARMTAAVRHRGPDGEGFWHGAGVGLGHRRLSVIDLAGGAQPMTDTSGQVSLAFNGEIYNFPTLRRTLEAAGYRFRTTSDTEVLLLGYLRWGEAVLERLVGMFAFALWDGRDESLLLARDRMGVKPLYWSETPRGELVFGSELTAVLASGLVEPRLNAAAVERYLALGYVVGAESILEGVERLAPGTCLRWRRGRGMRRRIYWDMAARWTEAAEQPLENDATDEFAAHLDVATRERLTSDVPLGVLLSGGLDSSMITALMRRHRPEVRSFSCGFRESSYDELPWAREAARALGTIHYDEIMPCDRPELLLEIAARQDEPFADTSIVPSHVLAAVTRRHVTVALSGDGGDELLAGYVTHKADAYHRRMARIPRWSLRAAHWALSRVPDSRRKVNAIYKAKQFLAGAGLDACDAHAWWRMLGADAAVRRLLAADWPASGSSVFDPFRHAYREAAGLGELDRMLYVDYKTWLVDDILVKADRASMAHGLEVRSPLLDHRLFEFCAALPAKRKLDGGRAKAILRDAAEPLLPRAVLRRAKAGFNAPVSHWLVGSWRELVEEHLGPERLRVAGVLDPAAVGQLFSDHRAGRRDHGYLLFALLQLSLWLDKVRPALPRSYAGPHRTTARNLAPCVP